MRESAIALSVLILVAVLVCFAAVLSARLRKAETTITDPRTARGPDAGTETLDQAQEAPEMSDTAIATADELARVRAALSDAQAALATVRGERDAARWQVDAARRQRHAFLAGLAHDLRNPLAPLSNGIELLRLSDDDPAGRLRTRGIMERQVGNLMRIADELSDLARLSGEHASLQDAPFRLFETLLDMAERRQPALRAQDMRVVVGPELRGLPPLRGDAQRLAQGFGHLVDDIARHAERGTRIFVSATAGAGVVEVSLAAEAPGEGDAASEVAFEDVDAARLGLGIALCDQLVALHGGRLRARRPAGARRVRFTVTLPVDAGAALADAAPPAAPVPPSADAVALRVLLADDNVDFAQSFGTMLELLGHQVDVVHDGLAAVTSIVGSPPDVAFVDIGMPSLDGVAAVRRVRAQGDTQGMLLVAVSGRGGAEDRARAVEAGFDRYLAKPFSMQEVRDALDAAQALRGDGGGAVARASGSFASARAG